MVADDVKVVLPGDSIAQLDHFIGGELDDSPTPSAEHVVVGILAEGSLVVGLLHVEMGFREDAAVNQQVERSVDGGFAHVVSVLAQRAEKLLRLEVLMEGQHSIQDPATGTGILDPVVAQVLQEGLAHDLIVRRWWLVGRLDHFCVIMIQMVHAGKKKTSDETVDM